MQSQGEKGGGMEEGEEGGESLLRVGEKKGWKVGEGGE